MFEEIHAPNIIALGVTASRFVDRNAGEISLHVAGNAVALIFVILTGPLAFKVHLSRCKRSSDQHCDNKHAAAFECFTHISVKTSQHCRDRCREVPQG